MRPGPATNQYLQRTYTSLTHCEPRLLNNQIQSRCCCCCCITLIASARHSAAQQKRIDSRRSLIVVSNCSRIKTASISLALTACMCWHDNKQLAAMRIALWRWRALSLHVSIYISHQSINQSIRIFVKEKMRPLNSSLSDKEAPVTRHDKNKY